MTAAPIPAYRGDEPFVFVSYSHRDAESVYPELTWLNEHGLHIWYDKGVSPGRSWREELATAIRDCSLFLVFLTEHAVDSDHVLNELDRAEQLQSPVLVIYLNDLDLPPGLALSLGRKQAIFRSRLSEAEYRRKLLAAAGSLESARRETPRASIIAIGSTTTSCSSTRSRFPRTSSWSR